MEGLAEILRRLQPKIEQRNQWREGSVVEGRIKGEEDVLKLYQ